MTFDQILMLYRTKKGVTSWESCAKALRMTDQGLRQIRNGQGAVKDATLAEIMAVTGLEAPYILGAWKVEHARLEIVRESWQRYLKQFEVLNNTGENQEVSGLIIM